MTKGKDDIDQTFSRAAAENLIAQSFVPIAVSAAKTVGVLYRNNEIPVKLTDAERHALHKYSYFGWTVAVVSGFGVFATLFGGLRFGSYLLRRRPKFQLSQPTYHTEMAQKRAKFSHLDNPTTTKLTKPKPITAFSETTAAEAEKTTVSDVAIHVQFMLCSAISLLSALVMGNQYSSAPEEFPENLAALPLQTGPSILCERFLCPAVLEHHQNLLNKPTTYEKIYDANLADSLQKYRQQPLNTTPSTEDPHSDQPIRRDLLFPHEKKEMQMWQRFDQDPSVPSPNEVYENANRETAETAMMEAMQRLVYNCECRQAFAQDCRRNGHAAIDPITNLVNVPESGVPLRFLKVNETTSN